MITLDWKERLLNDCSDFIERKIPAGDFDFDIIYNAYPNRIDNKIPRDVVIFVANSLGSKMTKNHKDYLTFCDYIWSHKGSNGKIAFACIINKFIKKYYDFYFKYTKIKIKECVDINEIIFLLDKVLYPIINKQQIESIESLISLISETDEKVCQSIIKTILKCGKENPEFLKRFITKLEYKWLDAEPDFVKVIGLFLKNLAKVDLQTYLNIYKTYKLTREPIFVEILTSGLVVYDDFLYELYENWCKSGNARLKKAAVLGFKFLSKKKK